MGKGGKTGCCWVFWGGLGCIGSERGVDSERWVLRDMDGVADDAAEVRDAGGSETAWLRGVWGILNGWDVSGGCSGGSPGVFCCSRAMVRGPECGKAGFWGVINGLVDDDVACSAEACGVVSGS
jgi:hypothetical protein